MNEANERKGKQLKEGPEGWLLFVFVPLSLVALFAIFFFCSEAESGAVIASFCTAILTYFYVALTYRMVKKISEGQVEERRPYVTVDIEFRRRLAYIVIRNTGRSAAKEVSIAIEPDIELTGQGTLKSTLLKSPFSYLPPGKQIASVLNDSVAFLDSKNPKSFVVEQTYKSVGNNRPYVETYEVSVDHAVRLIERMERDLTDIYEVLSDAKDMLKKNVR